MIVSFVHMYNVFYIDIQYYITLCVCTVCFIGADADTCPAGSYCPVGTDSPLLCPEGTYNPNTGQQMLDHCINCTGGYFCNETGMLILTVFYPLKRFMFYLECKLQWSMLNFCFSL